MFSKEKGGRSMIASNRTHYIDPIEGDDALDGLSAARPVRHYIDRDIRLGDTVRFKCGRAIRDVLHSRKGKLTP